MPKALWLPLSGMVSKWIASFVVLTAPPDPGQLKEQPFPLGQEYCHSNATSDAPG
jgi:hypothetical protein